MDLSGFFSDRKIEYFSILDYSDCREINPAIMAREAFTPRSVIMFVLPYYAGDTVNLSRYSAARDYHIAIREVTDALIEHLSQELPGSHSRGYGDHSPINEVHAALISGLGLIGDNGLLINRKYGSYIFIGDVVTDIDPKLLGAMSPMEPRECLHCGACKRACPTGILRGEDTDCLSAITQRKGELTDGEQALMIEYNTAWGCDLCQSSCPYNKNVPLTPIDFFRDSLIKELKREELDKMSKAEFSERAFAWRGRKTVERNLDILEKHGKA